MLSMTGVAAHPQEAVLKAAALEVILELLLNIPRQDRALRRQVSLEGGIVFMDKLDKGECAPGDGACTPARRHPNRLPCQPVTAT